MNATIKLTDTEARISSIEEKGGITTVNLEWGGPSDNQVTAFDLSRLGTVAASGTNGNAGRTGWAVLAGPSLLKEGEVIPLIPEPETAEIIALSGIHGDRMIDVTVRDGGLIRVALDWEHIDIETNTLTDAATARIEAEVMRKGGFDAVEWNTKA